MTTRTDATRSKVRKLLKVLTALVGVLALAAGAYVFRNKTYAWWDARAVERAGFVERRVEIDGSTINYAEGPDNGPPLLLIHGQTTDWRNWSRVLPELSTRFHVFAVDCYGHGRSSHAADRYTANALAADLAQLIRQVVGEPAIVVGHSSGGLVAAGLAADASEHVRGVVLEDPPLFSSVLPRARNTFNYVDLSTTAHGFLHSDATDFTTYYLRHSAMWDLFQDAGEPIQHYALRYRRAHPDKPVELFFMPPVLNEPFRAMDSYDPRFGEAFYTNTFHRDFDHAAVLERITAPSVLIHTNWSYDDDGVLLAAMDGDDAERARNLLENVTFHRVDSGHGFHFEKPDTFIRIVRDFADGLDAG